MTQNVLVTLPHPEFLTYFLQTLSTAAAISFACSWLLALYETGSILFDIDESNEIFAFCICVIFLNLGFLASCYILESKVIPEQAETMIFLPMGTFMGFIWRNFFSVLSEHIIAQYSDNSLSIMILFAIAICVSMFAAYIIPSCLHLIIHEEKNRHRDDGTYRVWVHAVAKLTSMTIPLPIADIWRWSFFYLVEKAVGKVAFASIISLSIYGVVTLTILTTLELCLQKSKQEKTIQNDQETDAKSTDPLIGEEKVLEDRMEQVLLRDRITFIFHKTLEFLVAFSFYDIIFTTERPVIMSINLYSRVELPQSSIFVIVVAGYFFIAVAKAQLVHLGIINPYYEYGSESVIIHWVHIAVLLFSNSIGAQLGFAIQDAYYTPMSAISSQKYKLWYDWGTVLIFGSGFVFVIWNLKRQLVDKFRVLIHNELCVISAAKHWRFKTRAHEHQPRDESNEEKSSH